MKLTAESTIHDRDDCLWQLTQDPKEHVRWDLRFTDVSYLPKSAPDEPQRFGYVTRLGGGLRIEGWGETVARRGRRGSHLRFGSKDAKSLIHEGSGCWIYEPNGDRTRFRTVYDYQVRYGLPGRAIDRLLFRPLMLWATRWSFDRLRIWIESKTTPEFLLRLWLLKVTARFALALVWILEGLLPKLLFAAPHELDLVRHSGLAVATPAFTLGLLGVAEIVGGVWRLTGRAERAAALAAALVMLGLAVVVSVSDPLTLADPYGGVVKNFGLLICSLVVLVLAERTPKARRAEPDRTRRA